MIWRYATTHLLKWYIDFGCYRHVQWESKSIIGKYLFIPLRFPRPSGWQHKKSHLSWSSFPYPQARPASNLWKVVNVSRQSIRKLWKSATEKRQMETEVLHNSYNVDCTTINKSVEWTKCIIYPFIKYIQLSMKSDGTCETWSHDSEWPCFSNKRHMNCHLST